MKRLDTIKTSWVILVTFEFSVFLSKYSKCDKYYLNMNTINILTNLS